PMYDRPELAETTDRLWCAIRDELRAVGIDAPDTLSRDVDVWDVWTAPDLVFSQTCSLPYRARLREQVSLIGAPVHQFADCPPGHYFSVIVGRDGQIPAAPRLAVNDPLSQSGWAHFRAWLDRSGLAYGAVVITGAHRASARAVSTGHADLAALDAQSWALMQAYDTWAGDLVVLGRSSHSPALPFIAARDADIPAYQTALRRAIDALDEADRLALNLFGVHEFPAARYLDQAIPPEP
ncbi:MAG: PhnD/SsuA/transferrin family substrate-binding protein, partial [Pseudomonadota bacterium]